MESFIYPLQGSQQPYNSHFEDGGTERGLERFSNLLKSPLPVSVWEDLELNLGHYDLDMVS